MTIDARSTLLGLDFSEIHNPDVPGCTVTPQSASENDDRGGRDD